MSKENFEYYMIGGLRKEKFSYDEINPEKSYNQFEETLVKKFVKGLLNSPYRPPTHRSLKYLNWNAILDLSACMRCREQHGKIYLINEMIVEKPPLHKKCRCEIMEMPAARLGFATYDHHTTFVEIH